MSVDGDLSASLTVRRGAAARVGLERIALVEAIAELGSITAAARRLGLSYKGAWDGVQALNTLFDAPLVVARSGGKSGGAAAVTPRGQAVVRAFREVEREIAAALSRLEAGLERSTRAEPGPLVWSPGMRTSARNALRGVVVRIDRETVSARVTLSLGEGADLVSRITRRSLDDLDLAIGKPVIALVKSSVVTLAGAVGAQAGGNALEGVITDRQDGETVSEITLALGDGGALVATIRREAADTRRLMIGDRVTARIQPSDVLLAVE